MKTKNTGHALDFICKCYKFNFFSGNCVHTANHSFIHAFPFLQSASSSFDLLLKLMFLQFFISLWREKKKTGFSFGWSCLHPFYVFFLFSLSISLSLSLFHTHIHPTQSSSKSIYLNFHFNHHSYSSKKKLQFIRSFVRVSFLTFSFVFDIFVFSFWFQT